MCVTFVTCEVRVCGLRCRSGSSLYIYRVYLRTRKFVAWGSTPRPGSRAASVTLGHHSQAVLVGRGPRVPPVPSIWSGRCGGLSAVGCTN